MKPVQVPFMRGFYGEPLCIERAQGAYLFTRDGRRILDGGSGAVVANVGHGREELARLAGEEVARLNYVVPIWVSPSRERLVKRLAGWTPPGLNRFFFTSGGSEAVESAIKFAIFYQSLKGRPQKKRIISREVLLSWQHARGALGQRQSRPAAELRARAVRLAEDSAQLLLSMSLAKDLPRMST